MKGETRMFGFSTLAVVNCIANAAPMDRQRYRASRERYWKQRARRGDLRAAIDNEARRLENVLLGKGRTLDVRT